MEHGEWCAAKRCCGRAGGRAGGGWVIGGGCFEAHVPGRPTSTVPRDSSRTVSLGTTRVPVLKLPAGISTVPQAWMALLSAAVSEVTPSPTAPNARALQIRPIRRGAAAVHMAVCSAGGCQSPNSLAIVHSDAAAASSCCENGARSSGERAAPGPEVLYSAYVTFWHQHAGVCRHWALNFPHS